MTICQVKTAIFRAELLLFLQADFNFFEQKIFLYSEFGPSEFLGGTILIYERSIIRIATKIWNFIRGNSHLSIKKKFRRWHFLYHFVETISSKLELVPSFCVFEHFAIN